MPNAYVTFGGKTGATRFSYVNAWGGRPSVAQIIAPADFGQVSEVGDIGVMFNGSTVTLSQCRVARINGGRSSGGTLTYLVEDRRWKWQYGGRINGDYNLRQPDGSRLREKTAQELATLLFEQLGENDADVSALPSDAYPRAQWHAVSPLPELERLCNEFGCVIVLNVLQDVAEIHRIGVGDGPNASTNDMNAQAQSAVSIAPPDGIRIVGGQALFQDKLEFREALGIETDGKLKPIDELSYAPPEADGGWTKIDPTAFDAIEGTYTDPEGVEQKLSELAAAGVYKIYRLTKVADGWTPAALQGGDYEPEDREDIYPILNVRLEVDDETKERLPGVVRGVFIDRRFDDVNTQEGTKYPGGWSVDPETRTLRLSEAAIKYKQDDYPGEIAPAELTVIAAYGCLFDGVPIRYEKFANANWPTYGAGEKIEHHDEIVREVIGDGAKINTDSPDDNLEEVDAQCDYYLSALADTFASRPAMSLTLAGLKDYSPDGLLRQVGWAFDATSSGAPLTTLSYNCEPNPYVEPWETRKERRERQAADEAARREAIKTKKTREAR